MIYNYRLNSDRRLERNNIGTDGDFLYLLQPSKEEIGRLTERFGFPFDYLSGILDNYEKARIEGDDKGNQLLLMQYPMMSDTGEIKTYPCSIVNTSSGVVIFALNADFELPGLKDVSFERERFAHQMTYHLLFDIEARYEKHLAEFRQRRQKIEKSIMKSTKNDQLLDMIAMQASLIYFEDAVSNNLSVLTRYAEYLRTHSQDGFAERIFDIQIAADQSHAETRIQLKLMENLRDLFSNIVSNNLNIVMKIMTSATFVLGIPAIIVGFYGMNVPLPKQEWGNMWWLILVGIILICGWVSVLLHKRDMM
ncbi:magnesium transporter CorA family protein [Lactococcus termiticola]|uniref:Magnesium and cobalt transporter n=1 Tax=Lactococcus termiticola TaxID=2169526 RepID=A0A2R5HKC5_9LACT|nr:magnesium transporter CorA family protein [Lactococcus termiticola]GBG96971.1 magnesium and cobalt transporter [Lactococcus termiticola]